jgi:hypothetical protein
LTAKKQKGRSTAESAIYTPKADQPYSRPSFRSRCERDREDESVTEEEGEGEPRSFVGLYSGLLEKGRRRPGRRRRRRRRSERWEGLERRSRRGDEEEENKDEERGWRAAKVEMLLLCCAKAAAERWNTRKVRITTTPW